MCSLEHSSRFRAAAKYSGSLPGFHLMLQPMLGFCSGLTGAPASTASSAARRSLAVGRAAFRPRVVELPAIDEPVVRAEEEEIRRAGGGVGFGDGLRFVEKDRKSQPLLLGKRGGRVRRILRILRDVIGGDADDGHAACAE